MPSLEKIWPVSIEQYKKMSKRKARMLVATQSKFMVVLHSNGFDRQSMDEQGLREAVKQVYASRNDAIALCNAINWRSNQLEYHYLLGEHAPNLFEAQKRRADRKLLRQEDQDRDEQRTRDLVTAGDGMLLDPAGMSVIPCNPA